VETGGTIEASLEYSSDLFDAETVERLAGRFLSLLDAAVADPGLRLSDLPVLDERERGLLQEWSDGPALPLPERCVHELFEEQVDRAPDAPAVIGGGGSDGATWTYLELEARANRLARHLQAMGVGLETPVALLLGRSPELVQAMLGVQKAGGFYVPVDPTHPPERIDLMLSDCGASAVVTGEMLASLDEEAGRPASGAGPDNLAYALYTSGSTGMPKAVLVPHRPVVGLIRHAAADFRLGPGSRVLQAAAPAFDASVLEIFATLTSGATLCLASEEARLSGPRLAAEVRERGVTTVILTPAALRFLPDEDLTLENLALGGEVLQGPLAERWSGRARMLNCYGPVETTIYVSSHVCRPGEGAPPIGRPVANARMRVLAPWSSEPLPVGVPGELRVGGLPPARGYLGRLTLTAERWVPDPFGDPGSRLYRTGDLVRWRPDGQLEFLGRIDSQVKLRGVRIEPGEIEAALAAHPEVREALVVVRQGVGGEPMLVAYVVPQGEVRDLSGALRGFLAERLPPAMIPAAFVTLAALPVTPVGKIDLGALPAPAGLEASGSATTLPRTEMERTIAAVWREVLGVEDVDVDRNFFELGGHSLLLARVQARLGEVLGKQIPLSEMFSHTTVSALAAHLSGTSGASEPGGTEIQDRAAGRRAAMDRRRARGRN
jgi:amino acid adenylation domain-containing protein